MPTIQDKPLAEYGVIRLGLLTRGYLQIKNSLFFNHDYQLLDDQLIKNNIIRYQIVLFNIAI